MALHITREHDLSDSEIQTRAAFIALVFCEDPISRFWFGDSYKDNQAMWEACCADEVRKALKIGRIYTTKDDAGEILAIAVGIDAGHDLGDMPSSQEAEIFMAALPAEQKAFKQEFIEKQTALYRQIYPSDIKRENVYIQQFGVKNGHRGTGIGSALVKKLMADIKAEGYRTVLDTSTPINVSFYQKNGVKLNGDFEISHYKYGPLPKSFALATE